MSAADESIRARLSASGPAFLIGVSAGIASGLFGVGGGIVMVPAMVLLLGTKQHVAHANSLAAIVPIATVGAIPFVAAGLVDVPLAIAMAVTATIGARLGARMMHALAERQLRRVFVVFLLLVAARLALQDQGLITAEAAVGPRIVGGLLIGIAAGLSSAVMGVGGGVIMVPAMTLLLGVPQHVAQGTSLVAIVPTAVAGADAHRRRGMLDAMLIVSLALGGLGGAFAAANIALGLDEVVLQRGFAVLLVLVSLRMLLADRRPRP